MLRMFSKMAKRRGNQRMGRQSCDCENRQLGNYVRIPDTMEIWKYVDRTI